MTVSAHPLGAQRIFRLLSMLEATAELPMLALIFTRKLRPMIHRLEFGMIDVGRMMALPAATSASIDDSGVIIGWNFLRKREKTDGVVE